MGGRGGMMKICAVNLLGKEIRCMYSISSRHFLNISHLLRLHVSEGKTDDGYRSHIRIQRGQSEVCETLDPTGHTVGALKHRVKTREL